MKSPNNITNTTPIIKPWSGVTGLYTDFEINHENHQSSLETLHNKTNLISSDPSEAAQETTTIFKKNDAYYVYFHISELSSNWGVNLTSFSLWLMSLSKSDIVYIHQTGTVWSLTDIVHILGILGTECKARKIFVCDHPIENALFLLVCDEVIITKFGAMKFSNAMDIDPTRWDKIYMPYMKSLFAKAIEKNYLTELEVNSVLNDNAIIFKTARHLNDQGVVVT